MKPDDERAKLKAQRDGWRAVALHVLQGDFGETPPVEFLPETIPNPREPHDRTDELVGELRRREHYITDVEVSYQPSPVGTVPNRVHVSATLGEAGRILIQRRIQPDAAFLFSAYVYTAPGSPSLVASREVSLDLLLRYIDLLIAGYKLRKAEEPLNSR